MRLIKETKFYESNLLLSTNYGKCGKQKQQPSQHQICHQNIRHQKFLWKHQKWQHWPQQELQFEGNLFSKGPSTAKEMCKHSAFKTSLKGPLKETVIGKYSAFKGAPYGNCNVQVICFHRAPQQQLQFEGDLLSKGPQQSLKCVK